ncbi:restriction endonuclease subunit S [Acinetobacter faecalis]|nr:restriction endonuclease subunit S [Acinetobacter faecalis]MDY6457352.1 restriction endonuclease subunit S [Acinetobacter faecalis]
MTSPKLRFKEFDSDWSKVKLKELVISLDAGVSVNGEDVDVTEDDFSVLKTSCVSLGVFNANERKLVNLENEIQRLKEPLLDNSLVMNRSNTPLLVGSSAFIKKAPKNTYLSDKLWQIKVNDKADIRWLSFHLSSETTLIKLRDMATGTSNSMKNITKSDVLNFELSAPSKQEQTKIASFLSAVDEKVSQLTQKHQLLSQYKQGMMQKLFSQQIRFKADDGSEFGEWEEIQLRDVAERVTRKNKEDNQNALTISAQMGLVNQQDYFSKQIASRDLSKYYLLHKGEFAYNKSYSAGYPMGAIKRLKLYEKGVVSTLYICFALNDQLNANFFEQYVESGALVPELEKIAQEGARNHGLLNISLQEFFEVVILKPCLEEQTKIANFLSAIDQKIEGVAQQIEQAKQWKKGLLQQMFV